MVWVCTYCGMDWLRNGLHSLATGAPEPAAKTCSGSLVVLAPAKNSAGGWPCSQAALQRSRHSAARVTGWCKETGPRRGATALTSSFSS